MSSTPRFPLRRLPLLALVLLLLLPSSGTFSQETASWFQKSPEAGALSAQASRILGLAERLRAEGLPESLLLDRIREGLSKRIPPERLVQALQDETGRLTTGAALLKSQGLLPSDKNQAALLVGQIVLLLRSGLRDAEISAALAAATASDPRADPKNSVHRALAALGAVVVAEARAPLPETERRALVQNLLASRKDERTFDSTLRDYLAAKNQGKEDGKGVKGPPGKEGSGAEAAGKGGGEGKQGESEQEDKPETKAPDEGPDAGTQRGSGH